MASLQGGGGGVRKGHVRLPRKHVRCSDQLPVITFARFLGSSHQHASMRSIKAIPFSTAETIFRYAHVWAFYYRRTTIVRELPPVGLCFTNLMCQASRKT